MHRSEDAELEQMKEEFTKRIGESEAKLQAAAKVYSMRHSNIRVHLLALKSKQVRIEPREFDTINLTLRTC